VGGHGCESGRRSSMLGLKTSTINGDIRSGRLPGRYDGEPHWRGWLTTRQAVADYAAARA